MLKMSSTIKTKLLIVDDDPLITESLEKGLMAFNENYFAKSLIFKGDLQELMDLIYSDEYDVLILDIKMPKINGLEITKKLRSERLNTPIILMTGFSFPSRAIESMRSGADDLLIKPFSFEDINLSINNLLSYKNKEKSDDLSSSNDPNIIKEYYETGELMAEFRYRNEKLDGVCKVYRKWGTTLAEIYYKDGMIDDSINWFNADGQVRIKDQYKDNERTRRRIYENDGKIKKDIKH